LWGVPVTEFWFVEGDEYIGTVVVRHQLNDALAESGGHLGYHVVPGLRRRGHGTHMLAGAIRFCAVNGA
jgi:predicted acetyltransferase